MTEPRKKILCLIISASLITIHFLIFAPFLPNNQGGLGHDYSYFLPLLLDGYYWFVTNGLFAPHWFTPAFCAGVPRFANPQDLYYSVPQFLTFLFDPVTSLKITFFCFAAFGYSGFYLLSRKVFGTKRPPAILAATLFLFNGFYAYRFIIGHLTFHAFMLTPFLLYFLLRPNTTGRWSQTLSDVTLGALLFAYMVYSGMVNGIVPVIFSLMSIVCLYILVTPLAHRERQGFIVLKLLLMGLGAIAIASPKLYASVTFLSQFKREMYSLPGLPHIKDAIIVMLQSLFFDTRSLDITNSLVNQRWALGQHEFEFGVSLVPLILILYKTLMALPAMMKPSSWKLPPLPTLLNLITLSFLLILPITLNVYHPSWNDLLKLVPIIKNSSNLFRWFSIYIPFVIMAAVLVIERSKTLTRYSTAVACVCIAIILVSNLVKDKIYYHEQDYHFGPVIAAYNETRQKGLPPTISEVTAFKDESGKYVMPNFRNNSLTQGQSQLLCYEPVFGYRLELFPFKSLKIAPTMYEHEGWLNIKNPACFVYPLENNCAPGDHFSGGQKKQALAFTRYQKFAFKISKTQRILNLLSLVTLLLSFVICGFLVCQKILKWPRHP